MQCKGSVGALRRWSVSAGMIVVWSPSVWAKRSMARARAVIAVAFEVYAPACLGMSNLQRVSVSDDSSIRPRCAFSFPLRNVILGNELDGFGKRFRGDPATVESP